MKTPVKDGLNFKSLALIKELIPRQSVISSFLLYSGKIELGLVGDRRFVIAHTNKYVVYEFWECISKNPALVADHSVFFFNRMLNRPPPFTNQRTFINLQEDWPRARDPYVRAANFFLLNRCSEGGLASSGKLDVKNFNPISVSNLKRFSASNFYLTHDQEEDFLDAVDSPEDSEYLFFPVGKYNHNFFEYGKNRGYEETPVHHEKLYKKLKDKNKKWVVLYKKHAAVFDLYGDHSIIMVDQYGRKTNKKDKCEDIVIANF